MNTVNIAGLVAQRIRAIAITYTVPKRSGELAKSIHVTKSGEGYIVGTNKIYARRVHDGSGTVIIRPRNKKALKWKGGRHPVKKVVQKPRQGNPFFRKAVDRFISNKEQELAVIMPTLDRDIRNLLGATLKIQNIKIT